MLGDLRAIWISCFLSFIILFLSPVSQNWWVPQQKGVLGFVLNFCFHHSILWFLSYKLTKLKTTFGYFQVMETESWWHFSKYIYLRDPWSESSQIQSDILLSPTRDVFFFFSFFSHWVWAWFLYSLFFFFFLFFFFSFPFTLGFWVLFLSFFLSRWLWAWFLYSFFSSFLSFSHWVSRFGFFFFFFFFFPFFFTRFGEFGYWRLKEKEKKKKKK